MNFSPRIEDFATLNGKGEAIPFIGLDVIAHAKNNAFPESSTAAINPVFAGSELGLRKHQQIRLLINDAFQTFSVEGIIPNQTVIMADIDLAQRVTGKAAAWIVLTCVFPKKATLNIGNL